MRRQTRSEVRALLDEARAMELLAAEAEVSPDRLQEYWSVSANLLTLVLDIEELEVSRPGASEADPEMQALRRRLRGVAARLAELAEE
jgi:hypothetical protein